MPSLNVIVQALTLASGLLVNFLFPALFGLGAYGEFLQGLLATFVVHRLVDTIAEPLLAVCDGVTILPTALVLNATMATILATAAVASIGATIDVALLATMVCTSTIFLSLHRNRRLGMISLNLLAFSVTLLGLSLARRASLVPLDLREILLAANALGVVLGLGQIAFVICDGWPREGRRLFAPNLARLAPIALASSLVSNFLATILVFILSTTLSARELAMFRIFTSTIQASASIFPASLKALFVSFSDADASARLRKVLTTAFWILLLGTAAAAAVSLRFPEWRQVTGAAAVAIPYFWALCFERYLQASGNGSRYRLVNIVLFVVFVIVSLGLRNLEQAIIFYSLAASAYCVALTFVERAAAPAVRLVAVCATVSVGVTLVATGIVPPIMVPIALALLGATVLPPTKTLIPVLLGRI